MPKTGRVVATRDGGEGRESVLDEQLFTRKRVEKRTPPQKGIASSSSGVGGSSLSRSLLASGLSRGAASSGGNNQRTATASQRRPSTYRPRPPQGGPRDDPRGQDRVQRQGDGRRTTGEFTGLSASPPPPTASPPIAVATRSYHCCSRLRTNSS